MQKTLFVPTQLDAVSCNIATELTSCNVCVPHAEPTKSSSRDVYGSKNLLICSWPSIEILIYSIFFPPIIVIEVDYGGA